MTGRTRPSRSHPPPTERQLSTVSNTTTSEYDLLGENTATSYHSQPLAHSQAVFDDTDDDQSSSVSLESEIGTADISPLLSSSGDVDPDALLQLMSDQGTPTLHAIGGHSPLLDDDDDDIDDSECSENSLTLPDTIDTSTSKANSLAKGPTVVRVLYMGCATDSDKSNILKKLSEGLAEIFLQSPPSTHKFSMVKDEDPQVFSQSTLHLDPTAFKERKHHVLPLSATSRIFDSMGGEVDDEPVETYEDNGLSIIEADFTRNSEGAIDSTNTDTIYDYVIQHMMDSGSTSENMNSTPRTETSGRFQGFVYPDQTPDGVDLIVYFYSGLEIDEERQSEIEDEMVLLYKLRQLGIPILPILSSIIAKKSKKPLDVSSSYRDQQSLSSGGSSGSGTRHRRPNSPKRINGRHDQHKSNADYNQIMMENRTYLSNMFAEYRIQCLDVLNLEIGRPSFHRRGHNRSSEDSSKSSQSSGPSKNWETSSLMPAPWQILTVEQFAGVDKRAVYEALKKSREMAVKRETVREVIKARQQSQQKSRDPKLTIKKNKMKEAIIRSVIGVIIPFIILFVVLQGSTTSTIHLSNSTTVGPPVIAKLNPMWSTLEPGSKTHLFVVEVFDKNGRPSSLGPEGVKLKSSRLSKDSGGENTLDMAELGKGQYMVEIISPCYQENADQAGMHIEFQTVAGIQVQDSPVTLQACPVANRRPERMQKPAPVFQKRRATSTSAKRSSHSLRPLKTWHYRIARRAKAVASHSLAIKAIVQACDFVYQVFAFFWDEAGLKNLVQWLPARTTT